MQHGGDTLLPYFNRLKPEAYAEVTMIVYELMQVGVPYEYTLAPFLNYIRLRPAPVDASGQREFQEYREKLITVENFRDPFRLLPKHVPDIQTLDDFQCFLVDACAADCDPKRSASELTALLKVVGETLLRFGCCTNLRANLVELGAVV